MNPFPTCILTEHDEFAMNYRARTEKGREIERSAVLSSPALAFLHSFPYQSQRRASLHPPL
jgi:hypothetical protein